MSTAEKIQGINSERIQWCCDEYGVSLGDLAHQLNIAMPTLERARAGEAALSVNQLSHIARFFNRGVLFFLETEPVNETKLHSTQFRTLANQKPDLSPKLKGFVERVERHRDIFAGLLEDLGEGTPSAWKPDGFPEAATRHIPAAAAFAREWLELGTSESFDSYRGAVEAKGILVFVSNGHAGQWKVDKESAVRGFSLHSPAYPVIVVTKQRSGAPQAFTLMHELGHLLLHENSFIDEESDLRSYQGKEKAANAFAGHVLVPDAFLDRLDLSRFPLDDVTAYDEFLGAIRKQLCVSGEVVIRRLMDRGYLQQSHYEAYRARLQLLPIPTGGGGGGRYRYKEPLHVFGERYVGTVFDALRSNRITLAKASSYLDNLRIPDLHRLGWLNVHS